MITTRFEESVWNQIADYYYDNIHWNKEFPNMTIDRWVLEKFGATVNRDDRILEFNTASKRDWFILRWGM
jgi:hypothetical protein